MHPLKRSTHPPSPPSHAWHCSYQRVCTAVGPLYIHQLSKTYTDLINVYKYYADQIHLAIQNQGRVRVRVSRIAKPCSVAAHPALRTCVRARCPRKARAHISARSSAHAAAHKQRRASFVTQRAHSRFSSSSFSANSFQYLPSEFLLLTCSGGS